MLNVLSFFLSISTSCPTFSHLHLAVLASPTLRHQQPFRGPLCSFSHGFIIVAISLRPHTTAETSSRHDKSRVYRLHDHQEGKGPVVVVFNSLQAVQYIHTAPCQHCAPQSPLDRDKADRNQLDPLMKGTPG